jgi:hypothetical protein
MVAPTHSSPGSTPKRQREATCEFIAGRPLSSDYRCLVGSLKIVRVQWRDGVLGTGGGL